MSERVVVLRPEDPLAFLADACAALAGAVNGPRLSGRSDQDLLDVYAELVLAYSRLTIRGLGEEAGGTAQVNILGHLEWRLEQARNGEITTPVIDIIDRLHGELALQPAGT